MASPWQFVANHLDIAGIAAFATIATVGVRARVRHHARGEKLLKKTVASGMTEPMTLHPEIDPSLCAGCGACTEVCPEGEVLKIVDHKAVLVAPTKCVGHGECEAACPTGAISLVFGTKTRGMDIPRITPDFETNVPGLYIAGELGGMGLIRNAIKQGQMAARHALSRLPAAPAQEADVDLMVVGAGPAGLSASLCAVAGNKSYLCIDQNSFGGTVYNFPRQKVVMTQPAELPMVGTMKFKSNLVSKEQLLEYWNKIREKTGLKVQEQTKFEGIEREGDIFRVKTSRGEYRARKVILSMGVRGAPRKLGLPNEDLPKVTYNLVDPAQYQNKDIAVVGGGNAGVECAQMLADPKLGNRVTLLVRGPAFDRCNEENQRIINEMAEKGLVQVWFESSTGAIEREHIVVARKDKGNVTLPNDFLFVFAGAELPHKMLMGLGIEIDKKFGEALK